jgi:spermidine/putrescine transport system substrate-binding protein
MSTSKQLIEALRQGPLSRRQLHRWLATAGLGVAVMPILPKPARAADLVYYTWSGYDVKEFMPGFVEKHGSMPQTPLFGDEQEALTKIQSGFQVDVAHPCNNRVSIWRDAGVIEPVDTGRLEHWPELFDSLKSLKGTVTEDGQHWFLPVDWGMTALIYRSDLIKEPVDSWELLWDPKYKGKLSIGDGMADTGLIVATLLKIKDPNNMTADDLAKIKQKLLQQKPLLRFYWNDETTLERALTSGEVVASSSWNGAAATLIDQGVPVKFVSPKEGALTYCCGLVLARGGGHRDEAYDLMNAMSSPEAGKWLIETYGYGHSNRKAFAMVAPEMLAKRSLPKDPSDMLGKGVYSTVSRHLAELSQILEEVKASQ